MRSGLRVRLAACLLALAASLPAFGGLWPDRFGSYTRVEAAAAPPAADKALWDEYGLEEAEHAKFTAANGGKLAATAWRFRDSTGAFSAFYWQVPAAARPSTLSKLAAEAGPDLWLAHGNYLFHFAGARLESADLQGLVEGLARLEQSPLPTLPSSLPVEGMVPNSSRHIIGPVGLERFTSQFPAALAGFRFGAEAQLARYRAPGGEMTLVVFSYPTPHIAREQESAFQKLQGAMVKRTGPLVAVIVSPNDPNAAEKLLSKVRYQAEITWNERVPTRRDNVGNLILNIFLLIGILLAFAIVSGLIVGGLRALARLLFGWKPDTERIITLDLSSEK